MLRRGKEDGSRRKMSGNLREVVYHNLPTPATSEPGFTFQPVDKDGNPTNNPNERWYHPETGRLVQKGIKQALSNLPTPTTMDAKASNNKEVIDKFIEQGKQTCLSYELLRTPAASEAERGHQPASKAKARGGQQTLSGQFMEMFPTPTAQAAKHGSTPDTGSNTPMGANLWDIPHVLPTPVASDRTDRSRSENWRGNDLVSTVKADIPKTNWGKFEPAIRRWEATIGRPAPAPTKPDGKDGNHRLSSAFTEWMMGLPEGWITDVGLSRNEELKACGNGVVPQQAELALRVLLEGLFIEPAGGQVNLPTPTVSDTFTGNLKSSQQKPGSMHSVTLPQAVKWVADEH